MSDFEAVYLTPKPDGQDRGSYSDHSTPDHGSDGATFKVVVELGGHNDQVFSTLANVLLCPT